MTNVLVPTDFTPASVKMAELALRSGSYEKCNLILFHAFEVPSSPMDLLFGYRDPSCELMTEAFRQACKQVKDEYGKQVNKIVVRCMNGDTRVMFRNWAEANDIDLIYYPEDYFFKPAHVRSVNPLHLFKKCSIPVLKTNARKEEPAYNNEYYNTASVAAR